MFTIQMILWILWSRRQDDTYWTWIILTILLTAIQFLIRWIAIWKLNSGICLYSAIPEFHFVWRSIWTRPAMRVLVVRSLLPDSEKRKPYFQLQAPGTFLSRNIFLYTFCRRRRQLPQQRVENIYCGGSFCFNKISISLIKTHDSNIVLDID